MPAQHFVPAIAATLRASSRVQAHALRALALCPEEPAPPEWRDRAAAALLLGARWAGEERSAAEVARAAGVQEQAVAADYARLAAWLKKHAPP